MVALLPDRTLFLGDKSGRKKLGLYSLWRAVYGAAIISSNQTDRLTSNQMKERANSVLFICFMARDISLAGGSEIAWKSTGFWFPVYLRLIPSQWWNTASSLCYCVHKIWADIPSSSSLAVLEFHPVSWFLYFYSHALPFHKIVGSYFRYNLHCRSKFGAPLSVICVVLSNGEVLLWKPVY